jgi:RimJ/RimL family protein N-acetyltransferase
MVKPLSVEAPCRLTVINGEMVDLKPFSLDDLEFLYTWNNDPDYVGEYEPQEEVTREELEKWLLKEKPGQRWYVIQTKKGRRVGQLVAREKEDNTIQIGYRVTPPARNKGYCTAAVRTVVNHFFSETDAERIVAEANPRNTASIRVLEKAGFTQTGYKEKAIEVNGVWMDGVVYELDKIDWLTARRRARPRG